MKDPVYTGAMGYTVSQGLAESDLSQWLKDAAKKHGTFKDGRVDYTNADTAPVVMVTVLVGDEILLVKRGHGLADADGYWSTVNGFIDEDKPVGQIAAQELKEEIGLKLSPQKIRVARSYTLSNPAEKRSYIVFPCLIKLNTKPKIVLNNENTEFTWTSRDKIDGYEMLEDTPETIDAALKLAK